MRASVALDLPVFKFYYYRVPSSLEKVIHPGSRVLVPVRSRMVTGIVIDIDDEKGSEEYSEIADLLDEEPLIPSDLLKLLLWASEFYIYPPGQVIHGVIPPSMKVQSSSYISRGERFDELKYLDEVVYNFFSHRRSVRLSTLVRGTGRSYSKIMKYVARGFLSRGEKRKGEKFRENFYRLKEHDPSLIRGKKERIVVDFLKGEEWISEKELKEKLKVTTAQLRRLIEKGVVEVKSEYVLKPLSWAKDDVEVSYELTASQRKALAEIEEMFKEKRIVLLKGYTGSGKSVIYLKLMEKYLDRGQSVIFLVPEISLTPQLIRFYTSVFGDQVAVFHSGLNEGEKFSEFMKIRKGEKRIVIGVRSAIFAPVVNPGLIIIDEEHESTYKQEEGFIYHARSVAFKRSEITGANLLLGSATPSVESYHAAKKGKIGLVEIRERYGKSSLPVLKVVDIRGKDLHFGVFSDELYRGIKKRLENREQVMIFLNRRGFSTSIICEECGEVIKCPNCSVPMVYHRESGRLVCHYCNFSREVPPYCPACGSSRLKEIGAGTERIEDVSKLLFPSAKVARFDRDSIRSRKKYEEIISQMERGEIDILVGTQMVTKGFHFENVTLSGVVLADQTLFMSDFRAGERTYQLITQITGRAGRGEKGGEAIIQTYNPEHFVIQNIGEENYEKFFENELMIRKAGNYPPFARLLLFVVSAPTGEDAERYAGILFSQLREIREKNNLNFLILGPARNPIFYLRRRYRYNILLKARNYQVLSRVGRIIFEDKRKVFPASVKIKIDLDPYSFI